MELYIENLIKDVGTNFSLLIYLFVFLAGIVTSIGPCNLSIMPVAIAVVAGSPVQSHWQGFKLSTAFVFGASITFMSLGLFIALVGGIFGQVNNYLFYLVGVISIVIGLQMLGVLNFNIGLNRGIDGENFRGKGVMGALGLGIIMGLVGSQCGTPILLVILSFVMAEGSLIYGASLLFIYAMGRGIPIILLGTFTGLIKNMGRIVKFSSGLEKFSGVILIIIGLYYFWIV